MRYPLVIGMKFKRNTHLHSKEHLLSDDLSRLMGEPKRFGAYLGIARLFEESDLRGLARYVREKENLPASARGKYFFAALKSLPRKYGAASEDKKQNFMASKPR